MGGSFPWALAGSAAAYIICKAPSRRLVAYPVAYSARRRWRQLYVKCRQRSFTTRLLRNPCCLAVPILCYARPSDEDQKLVQQLYKLYKDNLWVFPLAEKVNYAMVGSTKLGNMPKSGQAIGANYSGEQFFFK